MNDPTKVDSVLVKVCFTEDCNRGKIQLPTYKTALSAGADLQANQSGTIYAGQRMTIPTGIRLEIKQQGLIGSDQYYAQIAPRSGLAKDFGIQVMAGIIDADYRGEIKVILFNSGSEPFHFEVGDRIAQLLIKPVVQGNFVEAESLSETKRGEGGFGHTGR